MERLDQQMRFVGEIDRLKGVLRQTMLAGPGRRENSAEHSWHLAMMAVTLGEHAPPGTDIGRVTAMLLLHDLVEIDAGDLFVYADEAQQARQEEAERAAADRIFALLPLTRRPASAACGTSSRNAARRRPGSRAAWTGCSRCWRTSPRAEGPGRSTASRPTRCWSKFSSSTTARLRSAVTPGTSWTTRCGTGC
jgi:hypothetical protein